MGKMAAEIKKISSVTKRIVASAPDLVGLVDPSTRASVLVKHTENVNRAADLAVKEKFEADKEAVYDMTMRLYTSQIDLYRNRALTEHEIKKPSFHSVLFSLDTSNPQTFLILTHHAYLNDPDTPTFVGRPPHQSFDSSHNTVQIRCEFKTTGQTMENKAFYNVKMVNNTKKRYAFFVSRQAVEQDNKHMDAIEFGKNHFDIGDSIMVTEDDASSEGTEFRHVIPGRDVFESDDKVQFNISSETFDDIELVYNMYIIFIAK